MGNPFVPAPTTVFLDLSLNTKVLAFTAGIGFVTTVLFGAAPAWRAAHNAPIESLHGQRPRLMTSKRVGEGSLLVVAQMAFSLMILVAAGLFIRTFSELANLRLGFKPQHVLIVNVDMRRQPVDLAERPALYRRLREAAGAVPGVASTAWSMTTPMSGAAMAMPSFELPGGPPIVEQGPSVEKNLISPEWFRTLGTRLLAGRDFTTRDRSGAQPVVIVNEAFARKFMNGPNPVGRTLRQGYPEVGEAILEIVGVVEDAVYRSVRETAPPTIYLPLQQAEARDLDAFPISNVVVRPTAGSPESIASSVAAALSEVDSELAISTVAMEGRIRAAYNHERILAMLASAFGGLALLLAMLGLYGVASDAVTRRRREIAIRMAVGASRASVFRMVLRRVVLLVAIGGAFGGLVSFWAVKFAQSLLFGLPARDPQVFTVAGTVLIVAALAAGIVPARLAAGLSPIHAHLLATIQLDDVRAMAPIVVRLKRLLDLDADVELIGRHLSGDRALAPLVAKRPGLRVPGAWDGFEVAVRAVVGQQITVAAARRLAGKMTERYGERFPKPVGGLSRLFPRPERLARADARSLGMPRSRRRTIVTIAKAAIAEPDLFRHGSVERLKALPGIGDWTAQYVTMRALGEPDAFPLSDIGLLCASDNGHGRPTPKELLAQSESWRPWRAYAAQHLWTEDADVQ